MQDGGRLGEARRFEDDPAEGRQGARVSARYDVAQRLDEIAAQGAADAAAVDEDGVPSGPS